MKHIFAILGTVIMMGAMVMGAAPAPAQDLVTSAPNAYVVDITTGTVLLSKNADVALPPASMSKLMTINMLFEALRDGRVTMDTRFGVSSHAKSMAGSSMFLDERDTPTVEDLIQGIVVLSGNDAAVVVAEGLAGSEAAFAARMNARAPEIGLTNSHFVNASGWPDPEHRMSLHDLATLATRLVTQFPEYYPYFAQTEFPFDGRAPKNRFNRNPLLTMGVGADGLKTGHTEAAGYGLVGSAVSGDRRIVFVISGMPSEAARIEEGRRLVNWAFRQFVKKTAAKVGAPVADAPVWLGSAPSVPLVVETDAEVLIPLGAQDKVTVTASYQSPVSAPVRAGQVLGELVVTVPDMAEQRIPLVAALDVGKGGFGVRLRTAAQHLMRQAVDKVTSF